MQTYCVIWSFFGRWDYTVRWLDFCLNLFLGWCVLAKMIMCWRSLDAWYPMMESLLKPSVVFAISLCPCCKNKNKNKNPVFLCWQERKIVINNQGFYLYMVERIGREETRIICWVEQKGVGKVSCSFEVLKWTPFTRLCSLWVLLSYFKM